MSNSCSEITLDVFIIRRVSHTGSHAWDSCSLKSKLSFQSKLVAVLRMTIDLSKSGRAKDDLHSEMELDIESRERLAVYKLRSHFPVVFIFPSPSFLLRVRRRAAASGVQFSSRINFHELNNRKAEELYENMNSLTLAFIDLPCLVNTLPILFQ